MTKTRRQASKTPTRSRGKSPAGTRANNFPDTLRTSERSNLNRCRQRWSWGYNDLLRPRREAPALRFGTLIHRALEHYYGPKNQARRKPIHPARTFARLFDEELEQTQKEWLQWRDEDDEWHTYRELGIAMLKGYLEEFGPRDEEYIVLAVEQRFQIPIVVPKGSVALTYPSPTLYVGTFDRVLYHLPSRRLLFGDYKTTKNDPTKTKHLNLDEQAGAYWAYGPLWLATEAAAPLRRHMAAAVAHLPASHRRAVEELRFDGILYDFLKKDLPDDRPVNEEGYAVNKPKKEVLVAKCKKEGLPWEGLRVDEMIDVIDQTFGEGWAHRYLGEVSKKQPGPLFHREIAFRDEADRVNVMKRIYEDAHEIGLMRTGKLAIKKSPDRFICIGCPFIDQCELHETGADWEAFRDAIMEQWDPYATYEIDADELE